MKTKLNDCIADLYQLAQYAEGHFRKEAFERIQTVLPFDSGVWANGRHRPHRIHIGYLHNQPEKLLMLYNSTETFVKQDFVRNAAFERLGEPVIVTDIYSRERFEKMLTYKLFCKPLGIEQAMGIAQNDGTTQLMSYMALWRKSKADKDAFTEDDRATFALLHPHLLAADALWMGSKLTSSYRPQISKTYAVIDLHGVLRVGDCALVNHIKSNWPDWQGPEVPKGLFELAERTRKTRQTQSITLDHGLTYIMDNFVCPLAGVSFRLSVEQNLPLKKLSLAEANVARHYADGLTHKEIARKLSIAPGTVRNHAMAVLRKLGVRNKTELTQHFGNSMPRN